jgi:predicted amidophosphoribosyltransferase
MTTFADHFRMIAAAAHAAEDEPAQTYFCRSCDVNVRVEQPGDLCPACVKEKTQGYQVLMMLGRLSNGFESDHGTKQHAVRFGERGAVCGARPGKRSVGWSTPYGERVVTCPRCAKKLDLHNCLNCDKQISKPDFYCDDACRNEHRLEVR